MRTVTLQYQVWKYEEASEELKEKIIENYYDINVDHDWWDFTYDDALNIGLQIGGFDIGRRSSCEGNLVESIGEACRRIIKDHGKNCGTYKLAQRYFKGEYSQGEDSIDEFKHDLLEEYLSILRNEYGYLTSKEAIEETLIANEYEFNENGKIDRGGR